MLIRKSDMKKVHTSSVKSPSTLFFCSIRATYNRVHRAQNKCLMLKSYLPGINTSNFPKRHYDNILSEKLVNELNAWIENNPRAIYYPNVKDSSSVKINGTLVNKHKHLLQISEHDLHNYTILPISKGDLFCYKNS